MERERMKYTLVASNPSLYKSLYEEKDIEGELGEIEWVTPTSIEEMEEFVRMLENKYE